MAEEVVQEIYRTSDLYLAAYLKAKQWFVRFEKGKGGKHLFLYIECPDLRADVEDYFNNGEIRVNDYKNAIQDLKTMIYNS